MKMKNSAVMFTAAFAAICAFADMGEERQSRTYQAAMADYSAGRLDAAITGFEKAIEANANNASARFQLACLMQDHRKDWLGAMCSYREYLRLEPRSDKASLARERMAQCERELAETLAKKYSIATSDEQSAAVVKLRQELDAASKNAAAAQKEIAEAKKKLAVAERENVRLRRQLHMIGDDPSAYKPSRLPSATELLDGADDESAPRNTAIPDADDGADAPRKIAIDPAAIITDDGPSRPVGEMNPDAFVADDPSPGLRQGLAAAKELVEEDESGPELLDGEEPPKEGAKKLTEFAASVGSHNDKPKDRGDRPETYTVEEGDSLYRIARRFYGRESAWKQIRDANKATITTDGRVKAGQTIILP